MSDGIETPVFDLTVRNIHIIRIEGSGPLSYRVEQGKSKITLTSEELLRIAALLQADAEVVARKR